MKTCPDCRRLLPDDEFGRNRSNGDGLSTYCRECTRSRNTRYDAARRQQAGKRYRPRVQQPAGLKRCADCEQVKPLEQFDVHERQAGGYNCYCKPCRSKRNREWRFLREYGLTPDAHRALLDSQGGLCAICQERPAEHVDHDHMTGAVRGVLCFPCNAALGQLQDRVDLMRTAIDYLERTTWQRQQEAPGVYRLTSPRPAARPSPSSSALQHLICSRRG
jgi:hypothetical protein